MKKIYGSDKNIFKKTTPQTNKLKTNGRWKNFQSSINNDTTNDTTKTFQHNSRFKNFGSSDTFEENSHFGSSDKFERDSKFGERRDSKFGERRYSKFGKKRIYKSRYKKEETLDYFKTQKNATQRDVSLFDFAISKNKKSKEIKKDKSNKIEYNSNCKMTKEEKNFILNQYMYEEQSDEENIDDDIVEKLDDQTNQIIDF
jgi:hypothetical protein